MRNRHWGVAPSAAFGLGEPTTVDPDLLAPVGGRHARHSACRSSTARRRRVPRGDYYGLTSDRANSWVDVGTLRLTHESQPTLSFANTVRYANYGFNYQFDAPNFGTAAGGPASARPGTPLSDILVGRDSPSSSGVQTNLTDQFDLTARFDTGPLRHVLVAGIELARQTNDLDRYVNPFDSNNFWVPPTPLLIPDPFESRPVEPVSATQVTDANSEAGLRHRHRRASDRHLDLIAGVRLDRFAATYHQVTVATGAVLDLAHVDVVASPRVAVGVQAGRRGRASTSPTAPRSTPRPRP